jgi:hypothetical protein
LRPVLGNFFLNTVPWIGCAWFSHFYLRGRLASLYHNFIMSTQNLSLDRILTDAGTQMRIENSESTIADYVEALQQGCIFPPIVVFTDGITFWLADGFHRYEAHKRCGHETIFCEIREGTLDDAKKFACEANTKHGLPRTNEGKRKAIREYLQLPGIATMSDLEIARRLHILFMESAQKRMSLLRRKPMLARDQKSKCQSKRNREINPRKTAISSISTTFRRIPLHNL